MSPRRPILLLAAVVAVVLAGAACADGDDDAAPADGGSSSASTTAGPVDDPDATAEDPEPVPSAGCGTSTTRQVSAERRTVTTSEGDRWYLLTAPSVHDGRTPLPLVVDFHGLAEGAEVHTRMSAYGDLAEQEGFVVAFPQGTGAVPGWRFQNDPANPDLAYVDALLDQIGSELCVDTSRTYATGLSNGAFISSTLACARADRFAAVAPVAGVQRNEPCDAARPVPVLAIHGTADPILLFNGGIGDLSGALGGNTPTTASGPPADIDGAGYPAAVRAWAADNGCEPTPADTQLSPTVLRRVYECPEDADVEFYVVDGGGHSWPGSEFSASIERIIGPTTQDIDATALSWEFFRRFRLD